MQQQIHIIALLGFLLGVSNASQVQGYDTIRSSLSSRTKVPLRLPTFIPPYADEENPIYAIVDSVGPNSYSIQLAWAKDCNGGNWCHLGEIRGSTDPIRQEGHETPIKVGSGLVGQFVDFTCGAHCDDAAIYWTENGYHYSVAMKAEKRETLLKMARSAIQSARIR